MCQVSGITYNMSCVMCRVSCGAVHLSYATLTPAATAMDPPIANYAQQNGLQNQQINFFSAGQF